MRGGAGCVRPGLRRGGGRLLRERRLEIAAAMSVEIGKVRTESIAEVEEAVDLIEAYCGQMEEHRGFVHELGRLVPEHFGLNAPSAVTRARYDRRIDDDRLVELAPVVFEAATTGDAVARGIIAYSLDTQPLPVPFRKAGTPESTEAVQIT